MNSPMPDQAPVVFASSLEVSPCSDCGTPFMLVVMAATPLGSGLVVPGMQGNGQTQQQGQVAVKPLRAWRLCINCLRREQTRPKLDGMGWELVAAIPSGMDRKLRRLAKKEEPNGKTHV